MPNKEVSKDPLLFELGDEKRSELLNQALTLSQEIVKLTSVPCVGERASDYEPIIDKMETADQIFLRLGLKLRYDKVLPKMKKQLANQQYYERTGFKSGQ
jgi:hypothetical protein